MASKPPPRWYWLLHNRWTPLQWLCRPLRYEHKKERQKETEGHEQESKISALETVSESHRRVSMHWTVWITGSRSDIIPPLHCPPGYNNISRACGRGGPGSARRPVRRSVYLLRPQSRTREKKTQPRSNHRKTGKWNHFTRAPMRSRIESIYRPVLTRMPPRWLERIILPYDYSEQQLE